MARACIQTLHTAGARRSTRPACSGCRRRAGRRVPPRVSLTDRDRPAWHNARVLTIGTLLALRTYELGFHRLGCPRLGGSRGGDSPGIVPFPGGPRAAALRVWGVPSGRQPGGYVPLRGGRSELDQPGGRGGVEEPRRRKCQMPSSGRTRARICSSRPRAKPWPIARIGS